MKQLWQQRLQQHHREMLKYSRYVFNEFFTLALFIFLGALAYGYSGLLETLSGQLWWAKPLMLVLFLCLLSFGRLATLLQQADTLFLLSKESALLPYLLAARRYSLWVPLVVDVLFFGVLLPFQVVATNLSASSGLLLCLSLICLKDGQLWLQLLNVYTVSLQKQRQRGWSFYGLAALILSFGLWLPWLGLGLAVVAVTALRLYLPHFLAGARFQWQAAVNNENSRMLQLYRLINLFTDVPQVRGKVHRRVYFDPVLKLIKKHQRQTFSYLYLRAFLRGTEYFGLYSRLLIVGALVLWAIPTWWLVLVLGGLFLYLVGFQLLPFYHIFDENLFVYLYPVSIKQRVKLFRQLVQSLLLVQALVFAVVTFWTLSLAHWVLFIGLELVITWWLSRSRFMRQLPNR